MLQTVHAAVEGRTRYKLAALHGSADLKEHLEQRLARCECIHKASASHVTGSILVYYNSGNTVATIAATIEGLIDEYRRSRGLPSPRPGPAKPAGDVKRDARDEGPPARPKPSLRKRITGILPGQAREQEGKAWHNMDADSVLAFVHTSPTEGLTQTEALEHLARFGTNSLPEAIPRSRLGMLFGQFKSLPVALLGIAAGVSVFTGGLADAVVILSVVGINAAIGYFTESEAERTIESLKNLVRPTAHVVRDGVVVEISLEEVVPGDLLALRPGCFVSADARLVCSQNLTIDESALTGESLPVHKSPGPLAKFELPIADRTNMVYMGTLVTGGQGVAVVVHTGSYTEIGRLQLLVGEAEAPKTPMEKQLDVIGNQIVYIGLAVCGGVFCLGLFSGAGFLNMFKVSISLAVAAVPEGLPAVATTTLALGLAKMKRQNVLIRQLKAVETLGAVQTICFDKTGTVTENRMTVQCLHAGMRDIVLNDGKFTRDGMAFAPLGTEETTLLMHIAVLCNETDIEPVGDDFQFKGSSTETALVRMAIAAGTDVLGVRSAFPLITTKHRAEDRHFMATLHDCGDSRRLIAVKGSPPEVLDMCRWYLKDGERLPLTDAERWIVEQENERMAIDALRVLGFAFVENGEEEDFDKHEGLVWLGLTGMADPVRKGVKELIPVFHRAGIDTVMITGDQGPTAYAIGKELGLSGEEPLEILDSSRLNDIDSDALRALSGRVHVFARVSPANKLQIVQALQKDGKVVAMTGDGINDGPALKAADIGIALGATGTDIAREVADVILEKDDLETMIAAVGHGRTIYGNIRKSLRFLLATNFSEIMVMVAASTLGLGFPLTAMQLLWINLISDIFPGLALALEEAEPDVLEKQPRDPEKPIISKGDLKSISVEGAVMSASAMAAYGYGIARYGMGAASSTLAFQSLTLAQLLHALSCRSETHSIYDKESLPRNRYLDIALGGSLVLQALTTLIPGLRGLLGLAPIGLVDALVIGGTAAAPLLVNEARKKITGGAPA